MTGLLVLILMLAMVYSGGAYIYLAWRSFRYHEDWETVTFHLALCLILAVGFLLMARAQIDQVEFLKGLFADSRLR